MSASTKIVWGSLVLLSAQIRQNKPSEYSRVICEK
jgi:hypothetical protein